MKRLILLLSIVILYTTVMFGSTFSDTFNTGTIDTSKWIVSNWGAPGGGIFSPSHVDVSQGLLRLTLTQSFNNGVLESVGGEIGSKEKFGYGTYEFVARAASTSNLSNGYGKAVSGATTGLFVYVNNSQTEIDFEISDATPNVLWTTNYNPNKTYTSESICQPEDGYHDYKMVWQAGKIEFYLDNVLVSTHTTNVPSAPAYIIMNLWGTNGSGWGGLATVGVNRYVYVRSVSYTQ